MVAEENKQEPNDDVNPEDVMFPIEIALPSGEKVKLTVCPTDAVLDIRQFLSETPDACHLTSYHLSYQGVPVNDYCELREIPDLKTGSTLTLIEDRYDEHAARVQLHRTRDILSGAVSRLSESALRAALSTASGQSSAGLAGAAATAAPLRRDKKLVPPVILLSSLYTPVEGLPGPLAAAAASRDAATPSVACATLIVMSGWNPPPTQRVLCGDLFYLDVTTPEGKKLPVTASTTGFFVNSTTAKQFTADAAPASFHSSTLVGLLRAASGRFRSEYEKLLAGGSGAHVYGTIPLRGCAPHRWTAPVQQHTWDQARAHAALAASASLGIDASWQGRDWNEEFQSCKELPKDSLQARIMRDRATYRVYMDFVECATRAAIEVLKGNVPCINPASPQTSRMYVHNSIFLSFTSHPDNPYQDADGEQATRVSSNNDLRGITALLQADIDGVHTLATCAIDYRGHRIVAQSIVPGILHGDSMSCVRYGSLDNGAHMLFDPDVHAKLLPAAAALHLAPHALVDQDGKHVETAIGMESKGIRGWDGRVYVLDVLRSTPRDANWPLPEHSLALLRPELVDSFVRSRRNAPHTAASTATSTAASEAASAAAEAHSQESGEACSSSQADAEVRLNPNVLTRAVIAGPEDAVQGDVTLVRDAAEYLSNTVIPQLVTKLKQLQVVALDSQSLVSHMHSHGVNVRYLGRLAKDLLDSPHLLALAEAEMVTRAAKHALRSVLRSTPDHLLARAVAHYLNCMFGSVREPTTTASPPPHLNGHHRAAPSPAPDEEGEKDKAGGDGVGRGKRGAARKKRQGDADKDRGANGGGSEAAALELTTAAVWTDIAERVRKHFDYGLQGSLSAEDAFRSSVSRVTLLRSVLCSCGLQVATQHYDLDAPAPFSPVNITDILPLVKCCLPMSCDAKDQVELAKLELLKGSAQMAVSQELLTTALAILDDVYGPVHHYNIAPLRWLGEVLLVQGDLDGAIECHHKATVIAERSRGLDHPETALCYVALGHVLQVAGQLGLAAASIERGIYLLHIACGPRHPHLALAYMKAASVYQQGEDMESTLRYLHEALNLNTTLLGPTHLHTASSYHALAVALSEMGAYGVSAQHQKKAHEILRTVHGDDHIRTLESAFWLFHFSNPQRPSQAGTAPDSMQGASKQHRLTSASHRPQWSLRNPVSQRSRGKLS